MLGAGTIGLAAGAGASTQVARHPLSHVQATKASLRNHLATHDGLDAPHRRPLHPNPPSITTQTGIPGDLAAAFRVSTGQAGYFRYCGGKPKIASTDYYRFPVAQRLNTGGNVLEGEDATAWRVGFQADASKIALRLLGAAVPFRIIVDGRYLDLAGTTTATTSGRNFIILDFSQSGGKALRSFWLEGEYAQAFDGVHVATGDTVAAPSTSTKRMLILGDSFVAGAGGYRANDLFARRMGDLLGIEDVWASGIGTTGYLAPTNGSIHNLTQRIVTDTTRALSVGPMDVIMIAMGNNDQGLPAANIKAAAINCIATVRSLAPGALIFVNAPWDTAAPTQSGSAYDEARQAVLDASSGREHEGIWFLDQNDFAFDKIGSGDTTHPNNGAAGHAALATRLDTQIRAILS